MPDNATPCPVPVDIFAAIIVVPACTTFALMAEEPIVLFQTKPALIPAVDTPNGVALSVTVALSRSHVRADESV